MAKHLGHFLGMGGAVVALAVALAVSTANAGYIDQLEGLQLVNGATTQWRFEGDNAADRQKDRTGAIPLNSIAGGGGTGSVDPDAMPGTGDEYTYDTTPATTGLNANSIIYEAGYDGAGVSQAYRPRSMAVTTVNAAEALAQRRAGAGLFGNSFQTTATMTVEAVVKPDRHADNGTNGSQIHYILETRPAGGRGYFLAQQLPDGSRGVGGSLVTAAGSALGTQAGRPRILKDYLDPSHYYYVAVTYDYSVPAAPAVINSWVADLTAGGPLVQTLTNGLTEGTVGALLNPPPAQIGVGMFFSATPQEFFYGSIETMSIFKKKLTADEIVRHHKALTTLGVPEPASALLLTLGGLAFALRRRHAG